MRAHSNSQTGVCPGQTTTTVSLRHVLQMRNPVSTTVAVKSVGICLSLFRTAAARRRMEHTGVLRTGGRAFRCGFTLIALWLAVETTYTCPDRRSALHLGSQGACLRLVFSLFLHRCWCMRCAQADATNIKVLRRVATELKQRDACPDEVLAVFTKFPREGDDLPAIAEWAEKVQASCAFRSCR